MSSKVKELIQNANSVVLEDGNVVAVNSCDEDHFNGSNVETGEEYEIEYDSLNINMITIYGLVKLN